MTRESGWSYEALGYAAGTYRSSGSSAPESGLDDVQLPLGILPKTWSDAPFGSLEVPNPCRPRCPSSDVLPLFPDKGIELMAELLLGASGPTSESFPHVHEGSLCSLGLPQLCTYVYTYDTITSTSSPL